MLTDVRGQILERMPDYGLRKVVDLINVDRPYLVELKSRFNEPFVAWWCESDDSLNRWMYFRADNSKLQRMKIRRLRLDQVIPAASKDGFVYLVDVAANKVPIACRIVDTKDIPDDYIPNNTLLPKCFANLFDAKELAIPIDGVWSPKHLPKSQRKSLPYSTLTMLRRYWKRISLSTNGCTKAASLLRNFLDGSKGK